MRIFLMILQVIVSITLIGSILLQTDKDQGLSSSIAGAGAQFLGRQSKGFDSVLAKVTKIAAVAFIILAIILVAIQ